MTPPPAAAETAASTAIAPARLAAAAGRYAALGWLVLPLHTPTPNRRCSCARLACDAPGKHPRTRGGLSEATTDPAVRASWWRRWPTANVGVATGARSGLVVVDVDGPAGTTSLAALEAAHGPLPATRQQITARGRHLLFAHPGGRIPNSAGKLGEGLDVRGDGGFIVAAPSLHASGSRYTWAANGQPAEVAALAGWLTALLRPPPATHPSVPAAQAGRAPAVGGKYAASAVAAELRRVAGARKGSRNATLRDAAISLGTLVGAGALDRDDVAGQLHAAAAQAGLGDHEVIATIQAGLAYGQARPRDLTSVGRRSRR